MKRYNTLHAIKNKKHYKHDEIEKWLENVKIEGFLSKIPFVGTNQNPRQENWHFSEERDIKFKTFLDYKKHIGES